MWARMMLSEKLNEAIVIVPLGDAELDGPPVDPHDVVTSARATMLAPRTKIRFRYIPPPPRIGRELRRHCRVECFADRFLLPD